MAIDVMKAFSDELLKVMEKTIDTPTHFIIYYPYWDNMIKEFVDTLHISRFSTFHGLKPIIVGLEDIYSCSDNIRSTLENGGIVFLRLSPYETGV